jgi:hypothetical protein
MAQDEFQELVKSYNLQKSDFLDSLTPDDFRNGSSFNQAELIIDQLNESFYRSTIDKKDSKEFIKKAISHLFRQDSEAAKKALILAESFLEMRLKNSRR